MRAEREMATFDSLSVEAQQIARLIGRIDCAISLYHAGVWPPHQAETLVTRFGYEGAVGYATEQQRIRLAQRPTEGALERKRRRR